MQELHFFFSSFAFLIWKAFLLASLIYMLACLLGGLKTKHLGRASDRQLRSHPLLHLHLYGNVVSGRTRQLLLTRAQPGEEQKARAGSPWAQAGPAPHRLSAHKAAEHPQKPREDRQAAVTSISCPWCPSSPLREMETMQTLHKKEGCREQPPRALPDEQAQTSEEFGEPSLPSTGIVPLLNKGGEDRRP